MYCRHCGKEVKDKAIVCSGCGHPIEEFSGEAALGGGRRWSWFTMFVTIGVFVGLLLVAIIAGL
jgi:hypothetical protein